MNKTLLSIKKSKYLSSNSKIFKQYEYYLLQVFYIFSLLGELYNFSS